MEIGPLVRHQPVEVGLKQSLAEASRAMNARKVGAAIVMTEAGPGIITERDILRAVSDGVDLGSTAVEAYMTARAITAYANWDVRQAASQMISGGFRHLIVLGDSAHVEGILSIRDLVPVLLDAAKEI